MIKYLNNSKNFIMRIRIREKEGRLEPNLINNNFPLKPHDQRNHISDNKDRSRILQRTAKNAPKANTEQ